MSGNNISGQENREIYHEAKFQGPACVQAPSKVLGMTSVMSSHYHTLVKFEKGTFVLFSINRAPI